MKIDVIDGRMYLDNPDPNIPRCYQCREPLTGLIIYPTRWDSEHGLYPVKWVASHHDEMVIIKDLPSMFWLGSGPLPETFSHLYVNFDIPDIMLGNSPPQ